MLRNGLQAFAKLNFLMDLCPRGHSVSQSPCPLMESQNYCCHAAKDHKLEHFLCTYGFLFMHRIPAFLPRRGVSDPLLPLPHLACCCILQLEPGVGITILALCYTGKSYGVRPWLLHLLAVRPGLSELHFLICKMKIIIFFKCTQKRLVD